MIKIRRDGLKRHEGELVLLQTRGKRPKKFIGYLRENEVRFYLETPRSHEPVKYSRKGDKIQLQISSDSSGYIGRWYTIDY